MSSIEKQLSKLESGAALVHIEFYPFSSVVSKGKFNNYQKEDAKPFYMQNYFSDTNTTKSTKSQFSNFSKITPFSNNGEKYVVLLDNVCKITDVSAGLVKMYIRLIFDSLMYLKDFYTFSLDVKIGTLFVSADTIEFRSSEGCRANVSVLSPSIVNSVLPIGNYSNTNSEYRDNESVAQSSFSQSQMSNSSKMSAMDKLLNSDYNNRIRWIKDQKDRIQQDNLSVGFPYFSGMVTGFESNKVKGKKVLTELPLSNEEYQVKLNDQKMLQLKKKLNDSIREKREEKRLIHDDIQNMKITLQDEHQKNLYKKEEFLNYNNMLLENKKKLKYIDKNNNNLNSDNVIPVYDPDFFPFSDGKKEVFKNNKAVNRTYFTNTASGFYSNPTKAETPCGKRNIYSKWTTEKPIYERVKTPDMTRKMRIGDTYNRHEVSHKAHERVEQGNDLISKRKNREDLDIRNKFDQSLLQDMENKFKKRNLSLKYKEYLEKQINNRASSKDKHNYI